MLQESIYLFQILHDTLRFVYLNKGRILKTSETQSTIVDNFIELQEPSDVKLSIINQLISTPVQKAPQSRQLKSKVELKKKSEVIDFTSPDLIPCLGEFTFFLVGHLQKL